MECGKCGMKFIKKKMFNKHISRMHGEGSTQEDIKGDTKFLEGDQ